MLPTSAGWRGVLLWRQSRPFAVAWATLTSGAADLAAHRHGRDAQMPTRKSRGRLPRPFGGWACASVLVALVASLGSPSTTLAVSVTSFPTDPHYPSDIARGPD